MLELAQVLSDTTLVPIGVAVVCFVAIGSYTAWVARRFTDLKEHGDKNVTSLRTDIQEIKYLLGERCTKEDLRRALHALLRANPSLRPPDDPL